MGEVFDRYADTAGNYHYSDTDTGHHVIRESESLCNHCAHINCIYQSGIVRTRCDLYVDVNTAKRKIIELLKKALMILENGEE